MSNTEKLLEEFKKLDLDLIETISVLNCFFENVNHVVIENLQEHEGKKYYQDLILEVAECYEVGEQSLNEIKKYIMKND